MQDQNIQTHQKLVITDRKQLILNGVINIIDFSDKSLSLETEQGIVIVDGNNMKIENLASNSGEILVNGEIDGFYYKTVNERKGFFGRLFK